MRTIEEAKVTPVGHHAFIPFALACAECGRGRDDVVHGCGDRTADATAPAGLRSGMVSDPSVPGGTISFAPAVQPKPPADPLDAVIDGVTLRYLLEVDRDNRAETPHLYDACERLGVSIEPSRVHRHGVLLAIAERCVDLVVADTDDAKYSLREASTAIQSAAGLLQRRRARLEDV